MKDDFITPKEIKDRFPYFDPCPYRHNTQKWNGLNIVWPKTVFVNPPYSQIPLWLEKFHSENKDGNTVLGVFLLPVWTDRKWFHELILPFPHKIEYIKGRVKFEGGKFTPTFPSMIVYLF